MKKGIAGFFLLIDNLWRTGVLTSALFLCVVCCILEEDPKNGALTLKTKVEHNGDTALKRVASGGKRGAG